MNLFTWSLRALFIVTLLLSSQSVLATINVENIMPASGGSTCDGSFKVIADGSAKPFVVVVLGPSTYYEEGIETEINFSDLCPGQYQVEVTDRFGCKWTFTPTVPVICGVQLSSQVTPACSSSGGSISVTPTTGTAPYTYRWENEFGAVIGTTNTINNLSLGAYFVSVTDAVGCSNSRWFLINDGNFDAILKVKSFACKNSKGELYAEVDPYLLSSSDSDYYTFMWSNGKVETKEKNIPNNIDWRRSYSGPIEPGNYTVTITDAGGCTKVRSFNLENPLVVASRVTDQSCNSKIELFPRNSTIGSSNKFTYKWSNGSSNSYIDNLFPGEYCATVTEDGTGCVRTFCATISTGIPEIIVERVTHVYGEEGTGTAKVSAQGGTPPYTFYWSTGEITDEPSNLLPGYNNVTVTDNNGCSSTHYVNIVECGNTGISISINPLDVTPCTNGAGAIIPTITGGSGLHYYKWTGPNGFTSTSKNLTGLTVEGNYCLTVTDDCGHSAINCQYISCTCPSVTFNVDVKDRCVNGIFADSYVEFESIRFGIPNTYGATFLENITKDDGGYRFVLDWNGNKWGDSDDASFIYKYDGGFDFDGPQKFKDIDNGYAQTIEITITDFLGCKHTHIEQLSPPGPGTPGPFIENLGNYNSDLIGATAQTGVIRCREVCGGICMKGIEIPRFKYEPHDKTDPCGGGGTIYIDRGVVIATFGRNNAATEFVDYSHPTKTESDEQGNTICYYNAGCYFPFGTIDSDKITNPIYIIKTEKREYCSKTGTEPPVDPDCEGTIFKDVYLGDCTRGDVCWFENRSTVIRTYEVPKNECSGNVNSSAGDGSCKIYEYCDEEPDAKYKYTYYPNNNGGIPCKDYRPSCTVDPFAPDEDNDVLLIGGDSSEKELTSFVGKNIIEYKTTISADISIMEENEEKILSETKLLQKSELSVVKIYPNPFKDVLYIEYNSEEEGIINIQLLNALGINTLNQRFYAVKGANKFTLETKNNVSLGVYYLKFTDKDGNFSIHKVVH